MRQTDDRLGLLRSLGSAIAAGVVAIGCWLPMAAAAQTAEWSTSFDDNAAGDPPGRIGRLSEVQGVVWLFHPEEGEWISAVRNRPVTTGDRLSTEPGARLELRIGSSALRLDGGTDIEIDRLDDEAIDIRVLNGSLLARLRNDAAARDLLLATDDGSFTPLAAGTYRIDRRDGSSAITVWSGQAAYNGPQSALTVYQGQRAVFWIDGNRQAQYSLGQPQFDAFASWSGELDRLADRGPSTAFVSPEMTGAEDLDQYGRWTQDPDYGALWTPNQLASDWAPYSAGHWAWVSPWGWSWVDDAPWGFAPFHYGRWVIVRDRWSWAPGRYVARPVYSPALVGWIGGAGVSLTIGTGRGVGWFPLAPREAYLPPYRVSRGYVRGVNQPHFQNRSDIERLIQTPSAWRSVEYRNRKFHHGTTAIPVESFTRRGDRGGRIGVESNRRANIGNLDRLPVSALPDLPRPAWAGQRRDPADRSTDARDGRNPAWQQPDRPARREFGSEDQRRDGRFDRRRGDETRSAREIDPVRPPAVVALPPSVQPPPMSQRPFVQPVEPRTDWPANRSRRGDRSTEIEQGRQAGPAPVAPVFTAPVQAAPVFTAPVQSTPADGGDRRVGRPDRGDRTDRRGGRPDQIVAPAVPTSPPPAMLPPQPIQAPQVALPQPAIRPPRDMQAPSNQGDRRNRDQREAEAPRSDADRGNSGRDSRSGRNRPEQP